MTKRQIFGQIYSSTFLFFSSYLIFTLSFLSNVFLIVNQFHFWPKTHVGSAEGSKSISNFDERKLPKNQKITQYLWQYKISKASIYFEIYTVVTVLCFLWFVWTGVLRLGDGKMSSSGSQSSFIFYYIFILYSGSITMVLRFTTF